MAINIMCQNSKCRYNWEDNCTRNMNEERIEIGKNGTCVTFEKGTSDWYDDENIGICDLCKKWDSGKGKCIEKIEPDIDVCSGFEESARDIV